MTPKVGGKPWEEGHRRVKGKIMGIILRKKKIVGCNCQIGECHRIKRSVGVKGEETD